MSLTMKCGHHIANQSLAGDCTVCAETAERLDAARIEQMNVDTAYKNQCVAELKAQCAAVMEEAVSKVELMIEHRKTCALHRDKECDCPAADVVNAVRALIPADWSASLAEHDEEKDSKIEKLNRDLVVLFDECQRMKREMADRVRLEARKQGIQYAITHYQKGASYLQCELVELERQIAANACTCDRDSWPGKENTNLHEIGCPARNAKVKK